MTDNSIIIVLTHLPDQDCAKKMAQALVKAHLAACVNIGGAVESVYEWQGNIESQTEFPLQIKTTHACYQQVESMILNMHPYELPDIVTLNINGGTHAYLQWVNGQVSHEVD